MDDRLLELCVLAIGAEALWVTDSEGTILWRSTNATANVLSGSAMRGRRTRVTQLAVTDTFGERFVIRVHALFKRGAPGAQRLRDAGLTPAEVAVAQLVGRGWSAEATAVKLKIHVQTVRSHLRNIYAKLHVHSRSELLETFTNRMLR
jgi:DNA-binding CsgD family transcriptional regulator